MVYLICFRASTDAPLVKFGHAAHYLGFAECQRTFELRMKHHRSGNGSRLMAAVSAAGIEWHVARIWEDGDRNFERLLKNRKSAGKKLCPCCRAEAKRGKP